MPKLIHAYYFAEASGNLVSASNIITITGPFSHFVAETRLLYDKKGNTYELPKNKIEKSTKPNLIERTIRRLKELEKL